MIYPFNIVKNDDSSWRFELEGIHLIVDDFTLVEEKHYLKDPSKAIAYFNVNGHLYGVANKARCCVTAEEFYDAMCEQYAYFR